MTNKQQCIEKNEDCELIERSILLESTDFEKKTVVNNNIVEESLQEGPAFKARLSKLLKSLASKEAKVNLSIKMLEFMDPMNQ